MTSDALEPLETLDEVSGKPPESRISNARAVRQRISEMRDGESTRNWRRSRVAGLLDGNPPYSKKEMERLGRKNDANINLRTGEGAVASSKTPYYDLVFEGDGFIRVETDWGDDPTLWREWSNTMSEGITYLLDEWDGFDGNMQLKQWQFVVHGVGLPLFPDPLTFKFESISNGQFLVPDDAKADVDCLDECAIPRKYYPTELYDLIKSDSAAESRGWNIPKARNAIINAAPVDFRRTNGSNWEAYQDAIRTGDVAWSNKSNQIAVVDHFIKEFDGKITHTILLDDDDINVPNKVKMPANDNGFLFKRLRRFDSFNQIICPFFYDVTGEGMWHGVKGLGPKIYDYCQLENRLSCKTIDQAMLGLVIVPKNADDWQEIETISATGVTVFPPGSEFAQTKIADNLEGPLMVQRDLQNKLQSNTGEYRQRVSDENQENTLGQAQINLQQQAILSKGAINRYYKALDRLYREMVRRILNPKLTKSDPGGKEVFEFKEWCKERGVPDECFKMDNICRIRAVRAAGYGSPAMRQMMGQQLYALIPQMNERSRNTALRYIVSAVGFGQDHVDEFFPKLDEPQLPGSQEQQATDENNALRKMGGETKVIYLDNHLIHFDIAFSDMAQHIQELQQGQAQPMEVLVHLVQGGVHTKAHLNGMANDPTRKGQFEQRQAAWLSMSKVAQQLQQQLQEAAKAEAQANPPQPQIDPEAVAAVAKVHGELQLKQMKMQGDMQLKAEKQQVQQHLQDLKTAHDMRLQTMKAAQDAALTRNAAIEESQNRKIEAVAA